MKARTAISVLCCHSALLLVASTKFTIVSWLWRKSSWTWDYFHYSYQNGWGYPYHSAYTLAVVLAYLAAYLCGLIGYATAAKRLSTSRLVIASLLCVLGLISCLIEASHWFWNHHLSWIAIYPVASLLLAAVACFKLGLEARPSADSFSPLPANISN